jgi:hypothetical protein
MRSSLSVLGSCVSEEPLLADLRAIGWNVESVWTLVNTSTNYAEAIPVLLEHLQLPYSDTTRDGIARSLAVPDARFAWAILADEYRKEPSLPLGEGRGGAKQGLAAALSATATKEVIDELIAIAKDRSHGESRNLLLRALRRSKQPQAKQALEELANDPDLAKQIASWRKSR